MNKRILFLTFFLTLIFSIPFFIDSYSQQGSRDIMKEYCLENWQRDPVQCAEYVPEDYDEKKLEYSAQEAEKARQEALEITRSAQEMQRVCPEGSHVTNDNQGNKICVDITGRFVGYPNIDEATFEDEQTIYIGIGVLVIIIIIAGIGMAMKKKSEPEAYKNLPRQHFSSDVAEQTLRNQGYKCNDCKKPIGVVKGRMVFYDFDHKDGNHYNNSPDNCQALCKNCHALKTERERGMHDNSN